MDAKTLNNKLELLQWLSRVEDKSIIEKLLKLRQRVDREHTLSAKEKASIDKGIYDADKQDLMPHTEARKLYEKWL